MQLQNRTNPEFDQLVELVVDADTAQRSNTLIHIDIVTEHLVRKPSFQGRVSIPLRSVIEQKKVRDTWQLQGVQQGSITAELSWLSALSL